MYKWQCEDLVSLLTKHTIILLQIDPREYSVIAYDYASDDLAKRDLNIVYPNARIGEPTS
jgi:hypothetical protein